VHDQEDPYATGTCRWWHLSPPSPELRRLALTSDSRTMPAVMALLIRPADTDASG
jgi:hypothetical protein